MTLRSLARALGNRWVLWAAASTFGLRILIEVLLFSTHDDGQGWMAAGRTFAHDPSGLYEPARIALATTGMVPPHRLVGPPAGALLAAAFSWLPAPADIIAWSAGDALCIAVALVLLQRSLGLRGAPRAGFWLAALTFQPLFAELDASQIGGYILLLGVLGAVTLQTRAAVGGAVAGIGAALKLYPAALILAVRPRRLGVWTAGAAIAGIAVTAIAAVPLGIHGATDYVTGVLLPALRAPNSDCANVSIANLWARIAGGQSYVVLNGDGSLRPLQAPLDLPAVATVLTLVTEAALVVGAGFACRRSGYAPLYSAALAFALGGVLPGELNPYQLLPLLPVLLIVLLRCVEDRRPRPAALLVVAVVALLPQPCRTLVPNLWTAGALLLFVVACSQARHFATARPSLP